MNQYTGSRRYASGDLVRLVRTIEFPEGPSLEKGSFRKIIFVTDEGRYRVFRNDKAERFEDQILACEVEEADLEFASRVSFGPRAQRQDVVSGVVERIQLRSRTTAFLLLRNRVEAFEVTADTDVEEALLALTREGDRVVFQVTRPGPVAQARQFENLPLGKF